MEFYAYASCDPKALGNPILVQRYILKYTSLIEQNAWKNENNHCILH